MDSFDRNIDCLRCNVRPCTCADAPDPAYRTLEEERRGFEAYIREYFPHRSLARFGHTYKEAATRGMWLGWQAKTRTMLRLVARRA